MTLRERLQKAGKTKWLDIGIGGGHEGVFDEGFEFVDMFPEGIVDVSIRRHYHRLDIINALPAKLEELGKFDFIRMQHVFEHFSFEEGRIVLHNCSSLLKSGGLILLTVPDLRIHVQKYLDDAYKDWAGFAAWANERIPKDAPASAYFSIFAHSMPYESHKWCYDAEGLSYMLQQNGDFTDIDVLKSDDSQAEVPFTHNRPEEDLCVVATRK